MVMRTFILSDVEALQVRAILRTHAEMQDARVNTSMELQARFTRDEPGELALIQDMKDQIADFEDDRDNLQQIADKFL